MRVALRAAVAHPDVEVPVRTEEVEAALMVRVALVDRQDQFRRRRVGDIAVGRNGIALDPRVSLPVRVVSEEKSVRRVVRMEGYAQKALLAAVPDLCGDVEEGFRGELAILEDANPPRTLQDKQPRIPRRGGQVDRFLETPDDFLDGKADRCCWLARRRCRACDCGPARSLVARTGAGRGDQRQQQ